MEKRFSCSKGLTIFFALVFLGASAFAVVEDAACQDHYKFEGLKFNEFYPEKVSYIQGDEVVLTYKIENAFGSPLVEGDIKALVLYRGLQNIDRIEDDDIIDDVYLLRDVNIQAGDTYSGTFSWKIPVNAKPGIYAVNVYFPVKSKFNIAGLPFMTSVPGATTTFEVVGIDQGVPMLDKNSTTFNGEPYLFRAPIPESPPDAATIIRTKLISMGVDPVDLTYELFSWDDTENLLGQYTKKETVSGTKDLIYTLPALPSGVYVARITAAQGQWKSILKVRFFIKGAKGRFIWAGLGSFPLYAGEDSNVAFCISNSAVNPGDVSVNYTVSGTIKIIDEQGKTILEEKYSSPVTAEITGKNIKFSSPGDVRKLTLEADMYDKSGNLMDDLAITYDYSKFLNIEKTFTLTAPSQAKDVLNYAVNYADKFGDPLEGDVVVYLTGADGLVAAVKEEQIEGTLNGALSLSALAEGDYVLKAVEKNGRMSDKKTVSVNSQAAVTITTNQVTVTTTAPTETTKGEGIPWAIIALIVAMIAIVVIALMSRSNKNK